MAKKIKNWHLLFLVLMVSFLCVSLADRYVLAQWQSPNDNPPVSQPGNIVVNPMTEDLNLNDRNVFGDNILIDSNGLNVLDISGHICFYGTNCIDDWSEIGSIGDDDWTISGQNIYRLNGNVGIGTNGPEQKLHIFNGTGSTKFYGDKVAINLPSLVDAGYTIHAADDGSTAIVNVDDNSASGFWTGLRLERGLTNVEKWFLGMQNNSNNLVFRYNGTDNYMAIDTSGRIGVGVAPEPNYQFKVRQLSGTQAIHGEGPNVGVYGRGSSSGVFGNSSSGSGFGVFAENTNASGVALKAVGYNGAGIAAQFDGNVQLQNDSYLILGRAPSTPSGSCSGVAIGGTMVWDASTNAVYVCDGSSWRRLDFAN